MTNKQALDALAIADKRGEEVKELDFGEVFWACGVLADAYRAALTRPPVNAALLDLEAKIRQKKGFYAISVGHDEVKKAHKAGVLKGLDVVHEEVKKAIAAAEAQPAQTVVDVENNIKLLCHECGKTHEHEYNQPPRHGSCEVCGRQNMLCTRVMTEAARLQLERQKGGE